MDYADHLRTLSRPDLEQLLAHRSETHALASRSAVGYGDLATILALPLGTRRAVASLDRFHRQVLELACLAGGRLTPEFAADQGLEPEWLARAAAELARRGLGFRDRRDLWLPQAVLQAVDEPGRVGPPAAAALLLLSLGTLRTIANTLRVLEMIAGKQDLANLIGARLRDGAFVRELVADAPPMAASVLQALRALGGTAHWTLLAQEVPAIHGERGLWNAPLRPADDGVGWLRTHGLVLWMEMERRMLVPAEVEVALRGRLFAGWEPEPPPLELAPVEPDRHPVELVIEVDGILDLWREPVALLQTRDLGVRERGRVTSALGIPDGAVGFLVSLAIGAGLVGVDEPPARARGRRTARRPPPAQPARLVVQDEPVATWRGLGPAERWAALTARWRLLLAHSDEALDLVLDELIALPPGLGAGVAGLAHRLAWRHPQAFADADEAAPVIASAVATLHRLGIGGASASVAGVTDLGRAALHGAPAADAAPLFPAVESECTVTADLRIIVAGPADPVLARGLARLADLETASPARVYRLSEASLRRAFDDGATAAEIAEFLASRCPTGVPQNVSALVADLGRRYGRLRVGRAAFYLHVDDPALLAEVAADRRLRGLQIRLLAPTVAVAEGADEATTLAALRKAGYMPAVEGEPAAAQAPVNGRRRRSQPAPLQMPSPKPGPGAAERRKLADRLLARRTP